MLAGGAVEDGAGQVRVKASEFLHHLDCQLPQVQQSRRLGVAEE